MSIIYHMHVCILFEEFHFMVILFVAFTVYDGTEYGTEYEQGS